MSHTSAYIAKRLCQGTQYQIDRNKLHSLIFLLQAIHAKRSQGKKLVSDDVFLANYGVPKLKNLDRIVSCFGDRPIKNVFKRFPEEATSNEVEELLADCINKISRLPTHLLLKHVYQFECFQQSMLHNGQIIDHNKMYEDALLLFNKERNIYVISERSENISCAHDFTYASLTHQDICIGDLYYPTEHECNTINLIIDKHNQSGELDKENTTNAITKDIASFLQYTDEYTQSIFLERIFSN